MAEVDASDPILAFRPVGGADTDVTIRWRFWLKGPMSEPEQRGSMLTHMRRTFAVHMTRSGIDEVISPALPEMGSWFDRLLVWIRAEELFIRGPRTEPASPGLVQRVEFALKLPADAASSWVAIVSDQLARMGEDGWRMAAESWFGVAPVRSNPSRDQPRRNDSRLLPLQSTCR